MRTPKIVITFDNHNLPCLKAKNISKSQLFDAGVFLKGVSREAQGKRHCKFVKFFRCLYKATKSTVADKRSMMQSINKTRKEQKTA